MDYNKILDKGLEDLLAYSVKHFPESYSMPADQDNFLKGEMDISKLDKNLILQKFVLDGYAKESDTKDEYFITFNGKIFASNGGYTAQKVESLRQQSDLNAMKTLETRLKGKVVVHNRWLIGIGFFAGLYSLLEVVKFLYSYFHQ